MIKSAKFYEILWLPKLYFVLRQHFWNSHPLSIHALRVGNKLVLKHSSPLQPFSSWKDSNRFHLSILHQWYMLNSMMACKELVFFHEDLFFPCLPFALNFFFQDINTGQVGAQSKTENKNTCERNLRVFQVIHLSMCQRKSCCLLDTMIHLYWKTIGWIRRQTNQVKGSPTELFNYSLHSRVPGSMLSRVPQNRLESTTAY